MAVLTRRGGDGMNAAAILAHNKLCASSTIVGTSFHADITSVTSGDPMFPAVTSNTATLANATDLPSSIALANQLRGCLIGAITAAITAAGVTTPPQGHMLDAASVDAYAAGAHKVPDTTNASTLAVVPVAVDLTTTIALANQLKASFNAHLTQAGVHYNNDATNTVAAANASDLATSETLLNAIKTAYNAHVIGAPGCNMLRMISA